MTPPTRNLSSVDRIIRGFIGISVCIFTLFFGDYIDDAIIRWLLFSFGFLNVISLLTAWCPVYQLAKLSTYKTKSK